MSTAAAPGYRRFPFTLDDGIASRAAIGLVVLATDNTIEHEWRHMLRLDGVAFYEARMFNSPDINPQTLASMEKDIAACTALIRPGERIDVVAFGCTSGAMVIGEENVFRRIREARAQVACTSPITAALAAFAALKVRRIALLTPYVRSVSDWMATYIRERGFEVVQAASFEHENDNEVARIDARSIRESVLALGADPGVEAVFVSCTSLRVALEVAELERAIGKPVLSSNHAMAWHALRLAGVRDRLLQFGSVFEV